VKAFWVFVASIPTRFLELLNWLVSVAEHLLVLGFAWAAFLLGYRLLRGIDSCANQHILRTISENWKAVLILFLIPLLYRTIRRFLERAKKFAGIEAEPEEEEEAQEGSNPSEPDEHRK
jgi:hypothetical protein